MGAAGAWVPVLQQFCPAAVPRQRIPDTDRQTWPPTRRMQAHKYLICHRGDNIPLRRVVGSPDWLGAERETRESFLEEVDKKSGELTKAKGQQGRQRGPSVGVCRKENAQETGKGCRWPAVHTRPAGSRLLGPTHTHTPHTPWQWD